ncbi:MAG: ubiquinone anaerobic biosynthesis protein UbiV [Pseudomonadota bacterium]
MAAVREKAPARLTLGPLLFNWPADKVRDFYARIADEAPVDIVYLGEVVCPKRAPLLAEALADAAARLAQAGKAVVHASQALILDARDLAGLQALAEDPDLVIEANDVAALAVLEGRPHVVGPMVNVYNEATLAYLGRAGAARVCLPVELPRAAIAALAGSLDIALEVQVFGRLPLAVSARCYHARAHGLHKDNCRFVCDRDADGMTVETLDGEPFLAVNGIQTLSHSYCALLAELDDLRAIGIGHFRLSPHSLDMVAVARLYRDVLDGRLAAAEATHTLAAMVPHAPLSNGYYHGKEGRAHIDAASPWKFQDGLLVS